MEGGPHQPGDRPHAEVTDRGSLPTLVKVGGASPFTARWVAVALSLVAVLVIKPWGDSGNATTAGPGSSGRAAAPVASARIEPSEPPRSPAEVIADECRAPAGWRILTTERWPGRTVAIWWAIEPVVAADPADPRIPYLSILAAGVPALGYCAPLFGPDRPPDTAMVHLWKALPDGKVEELHPVRLQPPFQSSLVALYAPPGTAGERLDPSATWLTGRYLFSAADHWFGVDLRVTPLPGQGETIGGPGAVATP